MRKCLFICLTLIFGSSFAKDHPDIQQPRIIEVSGMGSVLSVPDRFSFSLSIQEKGKVAAQLNKAIVEKTNAVVQALIKIGVDEKDVQSLQIQFNPWVEYNGKTQEQKGFILTRQVKITLQSLSQYEQSIDTVLNLGVSNINQFSFYNSQSDSDYQLALNQALLHAQQRATDLAKVLGLKLAGVISISEQTSGQVLPVLAKTRQFQLSESYQAGEMSTDARVKVIFALQDAS
ncbi:SIMPL domain-containing protein [uncultured Paraglaciecola sp.]|uniref:SIMPL domain-containing protein n=1 Tax=uncultured Paraglaciecola sp. TaxID=1765024 RepID=UPI0030DC9DC2|tara:strand:+ start:98063 stop:98758 length:696 start_codon:yes stop_codon:yes gene_type:complete